MCTANDWLNKSVIQFTLIPTGDGLMSVLMHYGGLGEAYTSAIYTIIPNLYLKSNVKITEGLGTSTEPFQLSLDE